MDSFLSSKASDVGSFFRFDFGPIRLTEGPIRGGFRFGRDCNPHHSPKRSALLNHFLRTIEMAW